LFAGLVGGRLESMAPSALFRTVALTIGAAAIVGLVCAPFVKRWAALSSAPKTVESGSPSQRS
ncbi:MAG: hypothetical protein PVF90_08040, partial [Gemmatimonadota bacterium]